MHRSKLSTRGMTIIELLVTVAIVGILASVALPTFQLYRFRTRTTESSTIMTGIRVNQESFGATNDLYADITVPNPDPAGPQGPPTAAKRRWEFVPCLATCSRAAPADCDRFACVGFSPNAEVYYHYQSPAGSFGAGAINEYAIGSGGDVDGDGVQGGFTYQTANGGGVLGFMFDTVSGCPLMPSGTIHNCWPTVY